MTILGLWIAGVVSLVAFMPVRWLSRVTREAWIERRGRRRQSA